MSLTTIGLPKEIASRRIGFWVSHLVFYLGFIWIFVDKRRRGWMDLIGGTVVVTAPQIPYSD